MSNTEKRRVGRPRIRPDDERLGEYVGFRAPQELKTRLQSAAQLSGRSMSTEAQFRLERSFDRDQTLLDALALTYGREIAGLAIKLADAVKEVAVAGADRPAGFILTAPEGISDPWRYDQAVKAVNRILERARPEGKKIAPLPKVSDIILTGDENVGAAVKQQIGRHWAAFAERVADRLGVDAADRQIERITRDGSDDPTKELLSKDLIEQFRRSAPAERAPK